ncbi:hypothetical protein LTR15_001182 [Elasticomyces elasticus]|nr:hypothetical protein LTR15_001182 [Elasticomyces elasticus]
MGPPFPIWGEGGIMQWTEDQAVLMILDNEANLPDLMSRLHTPLLQQKPKAETNRYSLFAEWCLGDGSVEIMRKYLDSGVLNVLVEKYLDLSKESENQPGKKVYGHTLIVLAAGALSLGANLPVKLENALPKLLKDPDSHPHQVAREQVQKALQHYVQGIPYDYGNETKDEASIKEVAGVRRVKLTTTHHGLLKTISIVSLEGETFPRNKGPGSRIATIGPPANTGINYVEAGSFYKGSGLKPCWRYDLCGGCGKNESGTVVLSVCGRCKERRYCSKECQKRDFKHHKVVCSMSEELVKELKECLREGEPLVMGPQRMW